jgi:hypothetical protein
MLLTRADAGPVANQPLMRRNVDHPFSGEWNDRRDCKRRALKARGAERQSDRCFAKPCLSVALNP